MLNEKKCFYVVVEVYGTCLLRELVLMLLHRQVGKNASSDFQNLVHGYLENKDTKGVDVYPVTRWVCALIINSAQSMARTQMRVHPLA